MTISVHRLSFVYLDAKADTDPVWAAAVGIRGVRPWLGEPADDSLVRTVSRLRGEVQRSRGGDALERSLLLGAIDAEIAAGGPRTAHRDPNAWLERIALALDVREDDQGARREIVADIPRYLQACARETGVLAAPLVERASARVRHLAGMLGDAPEAKVALENAVANWRARAGVSLPMAREDYERLFRAIHRLWLPPEELLDAALHALHGARAQPAPAEAALSELSAAMEEARRRWDSGQPPIEVRSGFGDRVALLGPLRPLRPLDPASRAVLFAGPGDPATIAVRYGFPGEHALRASALRPTSDLRKVTAAPATVAGWRSFVASATGTGAADAADAALAAADVAVHCGMWPPGEAAARLAAVAPFSAADCRDIAARALGNPVTASSAFLGAREFADLHHALGAQLNVFVQAALAAGPLPMPLAAQVVERAVR